MDKNKFFEKIRWIGMATSVMMYVRTVRLLCCITAL